MVETAVATMTMEEYLTTSFPKESEPEYVQDHLEEKCLPDTYHAATQMYLGSLVFAAANRAGKNIHVYSELRVRTGPSIRKPDVLVYLDSVRGLDSARGSVVSIPPLAAIEITSPDDKWDKLFGRLKELVEWGAKYVYLVDPRLMDIYDYSSGHLIAVDAIRIPEIDFSATMQEISEGF